MIRFERERRDKPKPLGLDWQADANPSKRKPRREPRKPKAAKSDTGPALASADTLPGSERLRAIGPFDRTAYQREYMRKRRAKAKAAGKPAS